ncbi:Uma2 family endonuclease [Romeriopsis navalis]|uniref:Uma2 family endonuclease n=1 Tax=Romeriopsis navalis TaxID=2992132 RepID=UPI0021F8E210|nr:Uma2 family endonuclease [Romeriopsis navalis]
MTAALPVLTQTKLPQWKTASWEDYKRLRDEEEAHRLFFHAGWLLVKDMGWEGISHAQIKDLFIMLMGLWFIAHPEPTAQSMSGCLIEQSGMQAAAPDLMLYVGEGCPQWKTGEQRRVDLNKWRVPDLVGEIADTTLATDLDEMKQLYAALGIREYWVIDVQGRRVMIFGLGEMANISNMRVRKC